jgi:predicted small secreted protein
MNPILIANNNCQTKSAPVRRFAYVAGAAMLLLASVGATTSCATTRGFGQDVEKTGDKIQDAASR